jgi:UDP-glucose 4-epimerase
MNIASPLDSRAFPGLIAISGAAGRFGNLAVRRLHRTDNIVAIDPRDFSRRPCDVDHLHVELKRKRCRDLFRSEAVEAVIHLGPYHSSLRSKNSDKAFSSAIENFSRLLNYCDDYHVKKLILLSGSDVYGARARNPQFFSEEAPLLATGLSSLRDVDMMAQSFFWKRPDIETVILRTTHVTGGINNAMNQYLRLDPVPTLMGYDPMIQLIHEEDTIQAIRLALRPGHRGIFNVAGSPPIPLSRIIRRLGRNSIPVPHIVAKPLLSHARRMGYADLPPSYIDYLRYVCMIDDSRAREVLKYEPQKDLESTIAAIDQWQ